MFEGSCHCGAVRFSVSEPPKWLTRCNCSLCRRTGGVWGHFTSDKVKLTYDPAQVIRYVWGDKTLANISCKTCGGTTHWESISAAAGDRMGLNFNMVDPTLTAQLRVRRFDGADTWEFLD